MGETLLKSVECFYCCASVYSKALFTSVHYFVHLNLALALFLGYAVFVLGTQFGTENGVRENVSYPHTSVYSQIAITYNQYSLV